MLFWIVLAACGAAPCPTDRPLTDADLSCSCGTLQVDELPCEDSYCTEDGTLIGGGGCS